MKVRSGTITFLMCVSAVALGAQRTPRPQYNFAVELRSQVGTPADSTTRRSAFAIRIFADGELSNVFGWRVEGAYTQADYNRIAPAGTVPINEFGVELGTSLRAVSRVGRWRPYLVGGPIMSFRGSCNINSAFDQQNVISCGDGQTIRFGWNGGLGARYTSGLAGWDWFLETRMLGNLTSNGGGKSIAIEFGAGV